MKIRHFASGSKGNSVQVDNVLIDAGVKVDGNFELVLVTHAHIDHIKYLIQALGRAKAFYAPNDVIDSIREKAIRWSGKKYIQLIEIMEEKLVDKPDYVEQFRLVHDVPCYGYKVNDYVHITDTGVFDIPNFIKGQKFYTIESNYDPVELDMSGRALELIDRIKLTHMSNEQAIELAIKLDAPEVMFVHLSEQTNSPFLCKVSHELVDNNIKKHYPLSFLEIDVK